MTRSPLSRREPQVLPTDTPARFATALRQAADFLQAGEVVAVPTETVYGLAANALDAEAVRRIYAVKRRPAHNPIIVHVADLAMARRCVAEWPAVASRLARSFWPGPLTLVLRRAEAIPDVVTAGGATVGVRWPRHPFVQRLIEACGFPLAAPSANPANRLSPTTAEHVRQGLGDRVRLIIDGGACQVGIESTVLDLTATPPRRLRPGVIHDEALVAVAGAVQTGTASTAPGGILRSPGQLPRHYAPRARLVLLAWETDDDLSRKLHELGVAPPDCQVVTHSNIPGLTGLGGVSVIPRDPEAYGRALYAALHGGDEAGARCIVVEAVPTGAEWRAIADRLDRAAATQIIA